jgi:hypothetical protein
MLSRRRKRAIIIYGNCAAQFLAQRFRQVPALAAEFDIHWIRSFSQLAPGDEAVDVGALERCQILLEQVGDFRSDPRRSNGDLRQLPIPGDCRRIRFPPLFMNTLWPFVALDPRSEVLRTSWFEEGPYPRFVANRLIIEIMRTEADPDCVYDRFINIRIREKVDLDRLHNLTMRKILGLDQEADIHYGDFIARHFSTKRLFLMQIHPSGPMLRYLCEAVFDALAFRSLLTQDHLDQIEAMRGIGDYDAPIHPEIVEHFDLRWARGLSYRHHSEGYFNYDEFIRRYIRLDWTPSFYRGRHLARGSHFSEAETLLSEAVRKNRTPIFIEELQRVRGDAARSFGRKLWRRWHALLDRYISSTARH